MPEATIDSLTLTESGRLYLASLKSEARQEQTSEVNRFCRWYGSERHMMELRGIDIERYALDNASAVDADRRLSVLRQFLTYAKKQAHTSENLAVHVRLRRASGSSGNGSGETIAADRIEVTSEGLANLQREIEELRGQRPLIAQKLKAAMADKDFRENAPLDAAREEQAHIEARIRELDAMLKRTVVVEGGRGGGTAQMGCRVHLRDVQSGREVVYLLVGPGEVSAGEGKISVSSPVGRALVDRSEGDEVEVSAPSRSFRYRIEKVER